jgi:RHS repeat-associated protein
LSGIDPSFRATNPRIVPAAGADELVHYIRAGGERVAIFTKTDDGAPAPGGAPLTETPRGFTDHEHIQTVGLIHMNGRVQDPVLGRFISPDPSDALNPGVGFNRYAYALNNPLSFTDPSGFEIGDRFGAPEEAGVSEFRGQGIPNSGDSISI